MSDTPERVILDRDQLEHDMAGLSRPHSGYWAATQDRVLAHDAALRAALLVAEQERDTEAYKRREMTDGLNATVTKHRAEIAALREKLRDAERELAIAGVRGSPPPWGDTTIGSLRSQLAALRAAQGEEYIVLDGTAEGANGFPMLCLGDAFRPGNRVRVTKVGDV
jgi:multidrug efflux pump subunit AcrA (membrane-fusion protein)